MPIKAHPSSKPRGKPTGNHYSGRRVDRKGGSRRRRSLSGPSELRSDEFGSSDASESYVLGSGATKSRKRSNYSDDSSRSGSRPHRSRDNCDMTSGSDEVFKEYENIINRMSSPSGDRNRRSRQPAQRPKAQAPADRQARDSRSMRLCSHHREMQPPGSNGKGDEDDRWFERSGGYVGSGGEGRGCNGAGFRMNGADGRNFFNINSNFNGAKTKDADSAMSITGTERRIAGGPRFEDGGKASGRGRIAQNSGSPSGSFTKSGEPSSQIAYQAKMSPLTTDSSSDKTPSPKRRHDIRQTAGLAVYDANSSNRQQSIRRSMRGRNSPVSPSPPQSPAVPSPHPARHRYSNQYLDKYSKDLASRWGDGRLSKEYDIYDQSRRQCRRQSPTSRRKICPGYEQNFRRNGQPRVQQRQPSVSIYAGNHVDSDILARSKSSSLRRLYSLRSQHYDENDNRACKSKSERQILSWEESDCEDAFRRPRRFQQQQFKQEIKQAQPQQLRQQKIPQGTRQNPQIKNRKGESPELPDLYHENDTQKRQRQSGGSNRRRDWQSRPNWQASSAESDGYDDAASFEDLPARMPRPQGCTTLISGSARRPPPASSSKEAFEDLNNALGRRQTKMPATDAAAAPGRHWCDGSGRMRETRSRRQTLFSCPYMSLSLQTKTYECDRCAGYLDYTNNMNSSHSRLLQNETRSLKSTASLEFGRGNDHQSHRERAHRDKELDKYPADWWTQDDPC